jgi:phosphatidate cytidylyltransferase|tara:strand:+ start:190 stop:837 length:648 start_codon:yes stop_codon:yes gene_type:complete
MFRSLKKRIITSAILLILLYLVIKFKLILVYSLILFGVFSILEFFNLLNKILKNKISKFILNSIFTIYVFFYCFIFLYFTNFLILKIIIFILLLGCIASDIGGFIAGKILKGPKLTKISPNKTISGFIGALIFTSITISTIMFYLTNDFNYKILVISIVTSLSCQAGDLFISFLKRKAKVKDTGNLLPGHGGVLDRLDGIFLGIPFGFITYIVLS